MKLKRKHQTNKQVNKRHSHDMCVSCHNTGKCRVCGGIGCAECDYVGDVCPECLHDPEYYEDLEAIATDGLR